MVVMNIEDAIKLKMGNKLLRTQMVSLSMKVKNQERIIEKQETHTTLKSEGKATVKKTTQNNKYEKGLYNQLEKALNKIDELLKKSEEQSDLIKELMTTQKEKDEINAKLLLEIERLKNQINKNSSNSSKPGSSDTKPPKSGANMYNGRVKSGKSVGGQIGHKGNNLSLIAIEKMITNNEIIVKEVKHTIKSSFYRDKAKKLLNRLTKYKDNHLYFVKDFNVPFSNNTSEQDLRVVKTKTKVSGGFRSDKGAISYANILTIIKTAKKRGINPFSAIFNIFNNKPCFIS